MNANQIDFTQLFIQNPWLIVLLLWILVWKGLALWHAARRNQKKWYIALLLLNTLGILEMFYVLFLTSRAAKK